jgi:hypothetical protein
MRAKFSYWILAFGFMMLLGFQSTAKADDWDQKTTFTINQPVSGARPRCVTGGSYVIKRVSFVNPVVQILDASESKVYATVLAIPDIAPSDPEKPEFTFRKRMESCLN